MMSLLLIMLLYPMSAPSSILGTNPLLSVGRNANVLTAAPVYQQTISGASPAGQEVQASSLQSRLDRQNQLFKEQAASDTLPTENPRIARAGTAGAWFALRSPQVQ
jgi:hypothetical protein